MPELPSNNNDSGTGLLDKPSSKSPEEMVDYFKLDDNPDDDKVVDDDDNESTKGDKKPKTDKDEEDEIELKDEEPEDKLDLNDDDTNKDVEIDTPPRKKEILAKYPTLFKDFPFIEKMIYRDRQYTELFGSFDDAREVAERASNLDEFERDLRGGNTETILNTIKQVDKKAFDKIVDAYLPTLARVDQQAYLEVIGNVGKYFIGQMAGEARRTNNDDLIKAAAIVNQFLFGTSEYTPPKQRVVEDKRDEELNNERANFTRERFETVRGDLETRVDNTLRSTISEFIDPKGEMSPYVKKNAVRDALSKLHGSIAEDPGFRKMLDKMWESAFIERFDQNSVNRIRSAYLGKSKQLLKTIINQARAEALKGSSPSSRKSNNDNDEDDVETSRRRKGPLPAGRPSKQSGKLELRKGETALEFLSRD